MFLSISFQKIPGVKREIEREREGGAREGGRQRGREAEGERERDSERALRPTGGCAFLRGMCLGAVDGLRLTASISAVQEVGT